MREFHCGQYCRHLRKIKLDNLDDQYVETITNPLLLSRVKQLSVFHILSGIFVTTNIIKNNCTVRQDIFDVVNLPELLPVAF